MVFAHPRAVVSTLRQSSHFLRHGRAVLEMLVVSTGARCTLRCRDCGNFVPHLPQVLYPTERILDDLRLLSRVVTVRRLVQLQGGEPFLHPGVPELLAGCHALGLPPVEVATNGTVLPEARVLQALQRYRGRVRVSDYQDTAQKSAELLARCQAANVPCEVYRFAKGDGQWIALGGVDEPARGSDQEVQRRFEQCPFRDCYTLEDGLLGRCSRAPVAHLTGQCAYVPESFVDLRPHRGGKVPARLRADMLRYLAVPRFMAPCRHCTGGEGHRIAAAEQPRRGPDPG